MGLIKQLARKKEAIVKDWFIKVVESYPAETAQFLRRQQDPFANPVGQTTHQSLLTLIDLLHQEIDPTIARNALDPILRIRAVQDFTAARAVSFVFDLKKIIHTTFPVTQDNYKEMQTLEQRIDSMGLIAFDVFMWCREKIYEIKSNELKERTFKAFAKAGLIKESSEDGPAESDGDSKV